MTKLFLYAMMGIEGEKNYMLLSENVIKNLGLSDKEITLYELLLQETKAGARLLMEKSDYKRATVYSVIDSLTKKGLVEEVDIAPVMQYRALHPYRLKELAEKKVRDIETAEGELEGLLPNLTQLYHSKQNRPGIRFFEGLEGLKQIMADSLTAKEVILSYADVASIRKYIPKLNAEYLKKREKKGILKNTLVFDTEETRIYLKKFAPKINKRKFIPTNIVPKTVMQIYDNKVTYITLDKDLMIGVIIDDQHIYQMHKIIFEHLWNTTPESTI